MSAIALLKPETKTDRLALDIERWLLGDPTVNLAPDMYIGDKDDKRWVRGHSSKAYYVENDERATFDMVMREINARADNLFDMGVGGERAVIEKGLRVAQKIGAKNYFACDLATALADDAAELAERRLGINGLPVICDIFDKLPVRKPNAFVALLGLTLGNLETYEDPKAVQARLTQIFSNYAQAVTSSNSQVQALANSSHMLISYDANRNIPEVKDCYLNPEMGQLVRSCVSKAIDTRGFDYDVVLRETPEILFVSTGLRAKYDQIIPFNGRDYAIEKGQFLPVLNSSRFSVPFMTEAAVQAGWKPERIWSATGRVQYQHFTIR